jgi:small-conductance mechanosensitive channel
MASLKARLAEILHSVIAWAISPKFYAQIAFAFLAVVLAYSAAGFLRKRSALLAAEPTTGAWLPLRRRIYQARDLLFPLLTIVSLGLAIAGADAAVQESWLVRVCQSLAVVFLMYSAITRFLTHPFVNALATWIGIPVAILYVFGWLGAVITHLEAIELDIGNIKISAYGLIRVLIFGSILFWLGRHSNNAGQQIIRKQETLEIGTREVLAKLFQAGLFFAIFLLLLQIMGIDLTALAVFGGAVGVGLGFGLQAIASNFISGIIILLDRSLTVGDHIQLDDGKTGIIREMNMRSTVLETYDGKDIVVPNEKFITTTFINWTHKNPRQRYSLELHVPYKTDVPKLLQLIKDAIRSHPQVVDGPDEPETELADTRIKSFGAAGLTLQADFWMDGIDDGKNRVSADLLMMIWQICRDNNVDFPAPRAEVRLPRDE